MSLAFNSLVKFSEKFYILLITVCCIKKPIYATFEQYGPSKQPK